jgi:hypothetical protein
MRQGRSCEIAAILKGWNALSGVLVGGGELFQECEVAVLEWVEESLSTDSGSGASLPSVPLLKSMPCPTHGLSTASFSPFLPRPPV